MNPYIYENRIDQVLQKSGVRVVDDATLATFGLDKGTFTRGLATLLGLGSVGYFVLDPSTIQKIDNYLSSQPEAKSVTQESEEVGRSWLQFKDDWEDKYLSMYPDKTEDEIDAMVYDLYESTYPERVEQARNALGFIEENDPEYSYEEFKEPTNEELALFNSRGEESVASVLGQEVPGYYLNKNSILKMRDEFEDTIGTMAPWMSENQSRFFSQLFEETGYAESVYPLSQGLFSVEKNVGPGASYGFVQIMPETALSILNEVLRGHPEYKDDINGRVQNTLGMSVEELREMIKNNPREMLNDNKIATIIFYLKFANRSFKDIAGFKEDNMEDSILNRGIIWKNTWNTSGGSGNVRDFISKNQIANAKF